VGYFELLGASRPADVPAILEACRSDAWTWAAIDADTKLIPSWIIGPRDNVTVRIFVNDLAGRLANRIQLTSDGLAAYLNAVERVFRGHVDYAMLVKVYGSDPEAKKRSIARQPASAASVKLWPDTPIQNM
jgi:IS1 family transposase